ncbi:hypothetical protein G3O06_20585 [Burkholderia sp. Ac-20345]|uniref:hypothetical protein n=1 Tax=Burkholderia sp. Ac-20345 TaxID=2703891 RepID=UPI00197C898A|nr:hypothetical protein [Burkholderia sp. Ac-20345]MBN3779937.1 hypothetical protein [Burkholderia sp. Ac-20345]
MVFYLPTGGVGIYELKDGVHYKNKPGNLRAIEAFRVIRYVVTDHCSNVIRWRYYPHAESGQHTVRFLAWSMGRERAGNDPFHGAPLHLMVDPGATAAGLVKRFCKRLDIDLIVNKPGNARAKGSVEKGQDIIECKFESGLKFVRDEVRTFDDLNRLADLYQLHFNATAKHSRHGKARTDKWLEIRPDQLRTTPTETVLLSLATDEPESRTVSGDLSINFKARVWNVADVPNVTRGGKIAVHWHPFIPDTAMAVITDADGREHHLPLPEITKDEHGFPSTAAVIRSGYDAHADTVLETNRKAVKMLAAGASKITEAEAVSKGPSYTPFNGTFDPYVAAREETPPTVIPRIGNALDVGVPVVHAAKLSVTMAALQLQDRLGDAWRPDYFAWLERRFPDGVEEDQIDRLASQWSGSNTERRLQAC